MQVGQVDRAADGSGSSGANVVQAKPESQQADDARRIDNRGCADIAQARLGQVEELELLQIRRLGNGAAQFRPHGVA